MVVVSLTVLVAVRCLTAIRMKTCGWYTVHTPQFICGEQYLWLFKLEKMVVVSLTVLIAVRCLTAVRMKMCSWYTLHTLQFIWRTISLTVQTREDGCCILDCTSYQYGAWWLLEWKRAADIQYIHRNLSGGHYVWLFKLEKMVVVSLTVLIAVRYLTAFRMKTCGWYTFTAIFLWRTISLTVQTREDGSCILDCTCCSAVPDGY
jgi:hypothetical protein